jgi:hypothetical protein
VKQYSVQQDAYSDLQYAINGALIRSDNPKGLPVRAETGTVTNGINLRRFWDEISEKSGLLDRVRRFGIDHPDVVRFLFHLPQQMGFDSCVFESRGARKERFWMQFSLFKVRLS